MHFIWKLFKYLHLLKFEIIFPPKFCRIKKTSDPCVFCVRRYSSNNYLSFDAHALYFVRPLYLYDWLTRLHGKFNEDLSSSVPCTVACTCTLHWGLHRTVSVMTGLLVFFRMLWSTPTMSTLQQSRKISVFQLKNRCKIFKLFWFVLKEIASILVFI